MADADYEQDAEKWCGCRSPDDGVFCTKRWTHEDEHIAHDTTLKTWIARWHDGDTVSVKAGQSKPMAAVTPAPTYQWTTVPTMPTAPMTLWLNWCRCWNSWSSTSKPASGMCGECEATKTESKPAPAQSSRRELAADVYKRVIDWGSSFRTDRERYQQWSDLVVMLRKEKAE